MKVAILAYSGCVASGIYGFSDVLAMANFLQGKKLFSTSILGLHGAQVNVFSGPDVVPERSLVLGEEWDIIYVPPAIGLVVSPPELVEWIREAHAAGALAAAACAGVFFLAEAGILDSRPATTHWGLAGEFTAMYPDTPLLTRQILVDGGDYVCAGGLTSYSDLALHLITRFATPELTAQCARALILDGGRIHQAPYIDLGATSHHSDEDVTRAEQWILENYNKPVTISAMARSINMCERTFQRRFKQATGRTPSVYVQRLRIERAKRLLEVTTLPVSGIIDKIGYQDAPAFFRLFKSLTGLTPGEYRNRFGLFNQEMDASA